MYPQHMAVSQYVAERAFLVVPTRMMACGRLVRASPPEPGFPRQAGREEVSALHLAGFEHSTSVRVEQ